MSDIMDFDNQPMDWIGDWVGRWARVAPERAALLDADKGLRYSYGDLNRRADRLAHWLVRTAGVCRGDRICMLLRNRIEAVDLYLACGRIGAILAPLSYRLRPRELNDLLARLDPSLLVYEDTFDDLTKQLVQPPSLGRTLRIGDGDPVYDRDLQGVDAPPMNGPCAMSETYLYIHTGGTTGTPKICIVPYRQMIWNSFDLMISGGGTLDARTLITFPLFHIGGWNSLTPVLHGGGYAVITRQFDAGQVLDLISRERIRNVGAVEAMLRFIIAHPRFNEADLSSLESVTTAGAPCAEPVMKVFHDRGITITQAYGLTEAGPSNFIYSPVDAAPDEVWRHNRSIGTAMPHCDYRIVDPETLNSVPAGETGVLCMRSMHNFGGYLGEPERTSGAVLGDGWIYSGDLAREDEEGFVHIVGRADNMFISGGENVSPEEIEDVLMAWPEVDQAAVIAVEDERWGQVPVAAVVAGDAGEALRQRLLAHCREELAGYKVPRRVAFLDSLPVTGAGKIDRVAIAAALKST